MPTSHPTNTDLVAGESPWDTAVRPLLEAPADALWRAHSDAVNGDVLERWLPRDACRFLLKTDLFDEAMGEGLYPLLARHSHHVAAIDRAPMVLSAAVTHYPQLLAVSADVRTLPFGDETLDIVVSNSTLDHFASRPEVTTALQELHRVLRRGGQLLLTMDNLANPWVALRNALPFRLLRRVGLVAYPVGATFRPRRLTQLLREVGFEVQETKALMHCPRVLAVPIARRLQRRGAEARRKRFLRGLRRWERLADLPTRYLTGYFVGVRARKP